ncbi:MAG: GtrA family protein [Bdellovibrionales bacterium]|nr:GtrA family protein [Bdellovibrionales bacterium]
MRRFAKSALVGGGATLLSWGLLLLGVEILEWSKTAANAISLAAGSALNFIGNRGWVFGAQEGRLSRQAGLYLAVETGGYLLNIGVFELLVKLNFVHYSVARLLGTFLVFACYNFPLWRWVFRVRA